MRYALWVLQILLAVQFATAGFMKLATAREELGTEWAWVEDFSATQIKLIGLAEVAGAIGLVVPAATGILPILTPLAATGLALIMGGAVATHVARGEPFVFPLILAVLAAIVAWGRYRTRPATARG